jgi:hypothetical protein
MSRRRAGLTLEDLWRDGPAIRVSDLVAITSLSADTIRTDIASGELVACRRSSAAPFLIERTHARAWLWRMGFGRGRTPATTALAPRAPAAPVGIGGNPQPDPFQLFASLLQALAAMGLDDIVRNAVATANSVTRTLQTTVTHRAWTGQDGYGKPTFASPVTRSAVVELTQALSKPVLVRTSTGQEKAARAKVLFLTPIAANGASGRTEPIDPRDEITLPDGTTGPILSIEGTVDPDTSRPFAAEVWIG